MLNPRDEQLAEMVMSKIRKAIEQDYGSIAKLSTSELDMLDEMYYEDLFGEGDGDDNVEAELAAMVQQIFEAARHTPRRAR